MKLAEIQFEHLIIIQEESINIKDLPKNLRDAIQVFNLEKGKVEKNETEEGIEKLKARSVKIADDLQNHIEKDLEEEQTPTTEMKDEKTPTPTPAPAAKPEATPPAAAAAPVPEEVIPGFKKPEEIPAAQPAAKNVKDLMDKEGRIWSHDLAKYLGKSVNATPDRVDVDGITLERTLSYYREVTKK